jgi:hypothetical protein
MASKAKTPAGPAEARQARLEQELRANLQKRKALARARTAGVEPVAAADAGDPAANPLPPGPRSD